MPTCDWEGLRCVADGEVVTGECTTEMETCFNGALTTITLVNERCLNGALVPPSHCPNCNFAGFVCVNEQGAQVSDACSAFVRSCNNGFLTDVTEVEAGYRCLNRAIVPESSCAAQTCDWKGTRCVDAAGKWYENDCTSHTLTCTDGITAGIQPVASEFRCRNGTLVARSACACEPVTYECSWSSLRCTDWLGVPSTDGCSAYYEVCVNHFISSPIRVPDGYACFEDQLVPNTTCLVYPNNTCTFCIVPTTRGKEHDRRPGDILAEIRQCVDEGAKEVTLLGQNVNSFGYGIGDRFAFSKLLRACGEIDGLERVRFTSPHPAAFTDDVIAAMAETPNVMHQLHFPLQSGSDRILRAMRRSYRSAKFLDILRKIREAMPDAQISTDIIVGFPGETEEDFQETLRVVEEARFASAFTFIYSPRPGTPAAEMEQVPHDVVQDRFERLVALQERITEENLKTFEGRDVEVMVTGASGKKDAATHRVTGREKTGVLVHVGVPEGEPMPQVGDFVTATVTHAGRHNLIADPNPEAGQTYAVRH